MKLLRMMLPLSLLAINGFAQDVRYNYDRTVDFTKFKTYKWVQVKDAAQLNQMADRQVKEAIDAQLAQKGLIRTEGDADLLVAYQPAINQEKRFNSYTTGFGPSWGWGGGYYGGWGGDSMTHGSTSTIHVGAIGIDMYAAGEQHLVWRGEVSKTLDAKAKPDKQQKNLNKAMAKLLKNYPPPVKK